MNAVKIASHDDLENSRTISLYISELYSDNSQVVSRAIKKLKRYTLSEYSNKNRTEVGTLLKPEQYHLKGVLELAGFLQLQDSLDAVTVEELRTQSLKQAHGFAQIRAGNDDRLNILMKNVREMKLDDDFVYNVAPKLIYTRNKKCVDYLLELIMSDELNCTAADPESDDPLICAYRLMELLAPAIYYFPFTLNRSGSLKVDDYETALIEMRNWIRENKDSYSLDMESY